MEITAPYVDVSPAIAKAKVDDPAGAGHAEFAEYGEGWPRYSSMKLALHGATRQLTALQTEYNATAGPWEHSYDALHKIRRKDNVN